MSDNITDLYVTNLYLNNGTSNPFTFAQLPIHLTIPPSAFGWSPNNPAFTNNFYFGYSGNSSSLWWQSAANPPTSTPPIPAVTSNSDNYGTVVVALPPGNFNVTYQYFATPGSGIMTVTIGVNGTTVVTNVDTYTSDVSNENQAAVIPISVNAGQFQPVTITLTCTSKNGASTGYWQTPIMINIDSVNTTVM